MAQKKRKPASKLPQELVNHLLIAKQQDLPWLFLSGYDLTEIPEEVFMLKHLTQIDLSGNRLKSVNEQLLDLPNLTRVDLTGNPLEWLPNRPGLAVDLPTFLRCRNQIDAANITLVIQLWVSEDDTALLLGDSATTDSLRELQLNHFGFPTEANPIKKVLDSIAKFRSLEKLTVVGFINDSVPEGVSQLQHLKHLQLEYMGLRALPGWVGRLGLEHFSIRANKISKLPDSLRNLTRLKFLDLSGNPLERLPEFTFDLISLETLRCHRCKLKEIPPAILRLPVLTQLEAHTNPIESPPIEVVEKGIEAIRDYWRQRAETGVDYLCEAKLVILGEPGAGKTSLARKIENPEYKLHKDEKSTEGIDVIHYQFHTTIRARENGKENVLQRDFQVNIWDFRRAGDLSRNSPIFSNQAICLCPCLRRP